MSNLLVIDDDLKFRISLTMFLKKFHEVHETGSGKVGVQLACAKNPDLILLDLELADLHGTRVCVELKSFPETRGIPIIIITGSANEEREIGTLKLGADDFIPKPFSPAVLIARINARLRETELRASNRAVLKLGSMAIDLQARDVLINGQKIHLTRTEFDLMVFFANHTNQAITREKILQAVWPGILVQQRTVDTHLSSLRRKIREAGLSFEAIHGSGYILRIPREPAHEQYSCRLSPIS